MTSTDAQHRSLLFGIGRSCLPLLPHLGRIGERSKAAPCVAGLTAGGAESCKVAASDAPIGLLDVTDSCCSVLAPAGVGCGGNGGRTGNRGEKRTLRASAKSPAAVRQFRDECEAAGIWQTFCHKWFAARGGYVTTHLVVDLGDVAGCLTEDLIVELMRRIESGERKGWIHVHLLFPSRPTTRLAKRRAAHRFATESLSRLKPLATATAQHAVAWWILADPAVTTDEAALEAASLIVRLWNATGPDPLTAWCASMASRNSGNACEQGFWGTYRCFAGGWLSHATAAPRPTAAFSVSRVPQHRRDLIRRSIAGWNTPEKWLAEAAQEDAQLEILGKQAMPHPEPGWALCRLHVDLMPEDLSWWRS
ncbi:MAG: hypothetical protein ACYTG0_12040 [Planctomycetota bacterium]|jgi:hypothetical protein